MRITILGGASYIGYWIKEGFRERDPNAIFQVIDAPRKGISLIKKYKDTFISLNTLSQDEILSFSPSIVVINFYDLLSYSSLGYSVENNNALIGSINRILEVSIKLNCKVLIVFNKNKYTEETIIKKGNKSYYNTFNAYNTFYYNYLKTLSKVYGVSMKFILLPNIFGLYEPPESVVNKMISSIAKGAEVKISDGKREFIYIKRIIPEIVNFTLSDTKYLISSFTTDKFIGIFTLYEMLSTHLNKNCKIDIFEDEIILDEMVDSSEYTVKNIHTNIRNDLVHHLASLKSNG